VVILVIYVDDIIITGSEARAIAKVKSELCLAFDMTNLGLLHYCLGVEVWQTENHIFVSQTKYAKGLLDKFKMADCKISSTPMEKGLKLSAKTNSKAINESVYRQLVGSLIYLTATRPNLSYAVSYISRFMQAPKTEHWTATKRVLRYVKGTLDFGILYGKSKEPQLCGYSDLDWAGSMDDRKSTTCYVFSLGTRAVSWTNKKHAVSLSSTEAKYKAAVKRGM
jgi:hypothetical protein